MNSCDRPSFSAGCCARSRERADAERLRALLAHRERVAVVEAERHRRRRSPCGASARLSSSSAGIAVELEDLARDGAGVLGVQVDRAAPSARRTRCRCCRGRAGARPRRPPRRGLAQDLAEDVGLGEPLRADLRRGSRLRRGESTHGRAPCRARRAASCGAFERPAPGVEELQPREARVQPALAHQLRVRALRDDARRGPAPRCGRRAAPWRGGAR